MIDPTPVWDFDDPAGSADRFAERAARATTPDERTGWLTQQARALGLQGEFDAAHALLDSVPRGTAPAYVALERGRLLRSSGEESRSAEHFGTAVQIAGAVGHDAVLIDALHMLALVAPDPALLDRALRVARTSTDRRARDWDASILNNQGMERADAGDFAGALALFDQAVRARERIGDPAQVRVARWMVGWALRNLGRIEEARDVQRALKAELDALGEADPYVDEELSRLG